MFYRNLQISLQETQSVSPQEQAENTVRIKQHGTPSHFLLQDALAAVKKMSISRKESSFFVVYSASCNTLLSQESQMSMPQAILLDRDGTLIVDRHYLSDPHGVALLPGVGKGLARLSAAGCELFLVSNQSGIGRGYFTEESVLACQQRLDDLLQEFEVRLEDAVWCPHAPEDCCQCRKPLPGLWKKLQNRYGLDPRRSLMIGDKKDDLLFACNAGLSAGILVLTGKGTEHARSSGLPIPLAGCIDLDPVCGANGPTERTVAADFGAAVDWILAR